MEATIVLVVSLLGSAVSILTLVDAIQDRALAMRPENYSKDLDVLTHHQIVNESVRLILQILFLAIAIVTVAVDHQRIRMIAFWFLIAVPVILAAWSIYLWVKRHKTLKGK